jgi:hypothetical protein
MQIVYQNQLLNVPQWKLTSDALTFLVEYRALPLVVNPDFLRSSGLDINVCPIPVKTDVVQVDLVTSEKMTVLPFEFYFL